MVEYWRYETVVVFVKWGLVLIFQQWRSLWLLRLEVMRLVKSVKLS